MLKIKLIIQTYIAKLIIDICLKFSIIDLGY